MPRFKTILVTGANGFLGRHLVDELVNNMKYFVYAVGREYSQVHSNYEENENFEFIRCDLNNKGDYNNIPEDIDVVFHLASVIPDNNSAVNDVDYLNTNVTGTYDFFTHLKTLTSINKIVFSSSILVYSFSKGGILNEAMIPEPDSLYGISKLTGEHLVKTMFCDKVYSVLRFSSIYGHGQRQGTVLPTFIKRARNNETIYIYGKGNRLQNFIFIEDAIKSLLLCLELDSICVCNIGSSRSTSTLELAETIIKVFNSKSQIESVGREDDGFSVELDLTTAKQKLHFEDMHLLKDGLNKIYQKINYCNNEKN